MGNVNSQTRGLTVARSGAPVEDDPFAELADIFESELRFDPRFADEPAPARAAPAGRQPDGMDREFEAAFEHDLAAARSARPATMPSYETRYNGRATAKAAGRAEPAKASQGRPTHLTDEEIDDELDAVLRNLSAPARPRGRIVVETQSFAPERPEEERLPSPPQADMDEFEELIRSELAVIRPAAAASQRRPERLAEAPQPESYIADDYAADDDYCSAAPRGGFMKKALVTGVSAAALVLVAGLGFSMWKGGSVVPGVGDEPLLIKADAEPYKVAPKDPGGRAYPNQNKAVYDRVAAPGKTVDETPTQHALLKTAEEPMDLPKEEERSYDDLPGVEIGDTTAEDEGKDETRVTAATETAEASGEPVLQPRKVRTLSVGADGRLIQADAAPAAKPAAPVHAAATKSAAEPQAADPIQVAAVAPIRPAAPMVSEPAAEPAAVAAPMPVGAFFVQVSSQPSEAAAQQSMRSFGSKYGSVVGGRQVGIQSAEVAGKGTYWRVRVAANTKEEASGLCSKLKSAGASCFVTR
ncbi:SPOR domain-containing protein [Aureimonas leprariae]|uniref:SPOR domain-containing protein n=1 Tax=Plantimonas leprariae TaxID=2615207 RepID=A0A7V7PS97_9HYPH|nr:SPOR domain-containing protein [Aureimonas leprariae]KAB0681988.1 hypothetical protein F6X38_04055 [Aureimonas leprariae]